jgi:DNA-binding transcriptional LysR family regulator
MNHLQAMRVFVKVAETGSFGRAATALDLSNAVITRYVALLEAHLNTRLLNRTTRSVSLTEAGASYPEGCRAVLEQVESIESTVSQTSFDPSGTLKLVASASFSLFGLTPLLCEYRDAFPNVKLRLTLLHRPVDLVDEGFDVGIVVPRLVMVTPVVAFRVRKVKTKMSSSTQITPSTIRKCCDKPRYRAWASRHCRKAMSPMIWNAAR